MRGLLRGALAWRSTCTLSVTMAPCAASATPGRWLRSMTATGRWKRRSTTRASGPSPPMSRRRRSSPSLGPMPGRRVTGANSGLRTSGRMRQPDSAHLVAVKRGDGPLCEFLLHWRVAQQLGVWRLVRRAFPLDLVHRLVVEDRLEGTQALEDRNQLDDRRPRIHQVLERIRYLV